MSNYKYIYIYNIYTSLYMNTNKHSICFYISKGFSHQEMKPITYVSIHV